MTPQAGRTMAEAERAFAGRDPARAIQLLDSLPADAAADPGVLHLRALALKAAGRLPEARAAFEAALRGAPHDAALANNFANLLKQLGDPAAAIQQYDRALAIDPGYRDARFNRALTLSALGQGDAALAELDFLKAQGPAEARVDSARGALLQQTGRLDEAADAYDAALASEPARLTALHGRGRVAMDRGEEGAHHFYRRAYAQQPGSLDLLFGLAEALEAAGDPEGLALLSDAVRAQPAWIAGHELLARMRAEAGEQDDFADHYRAAIAARPLDRDLHQSYWRVLARSERYGEALESLRAAQPRLGSDPSLKLLEAIFLSESGDPAAALPLLDGLEGLDGVAFARGRIALRAGDPALAARAMEQVVNEDAGSMNGWANLDLAWRLLDDPRHQWLSGQPGLFGAADLDLDPAMLAELADTLRGLHRTRAHPIGQSLRGGTQTRGALLARREPAIARLRDALAAAVAAHVAALPSADPGHPLLRHRDGAFRFAGSWSVRLTSAGYHVNHIHPEGLLSSAFYVSLPATIGGDDTRDGWLELGRPPVELGLPLEPLDAIQPKPGRLALFPSYLFHGTRRFADGERLSVAFDMTAA